MYKLVAVDLDGTLLNSYGQISEKNKEIIQKALKKGIKIVLTSGRGLMSVKNLAAEVGTNEYIICGNGAIVYNLKEEKLEYDKFLSKKKVLQLIKICEKNSIYYSIYTQNGIITKSLNYNVLFYNFENATKPDNKKSNIYITKDIYNYILEREENDYIKITICDDNSIIFNSTIKKLREAKDVEVLDVGHMSRKIIKTGTQIHTIEYFYTEVSSKNVNKWNAIEFLIQKLGINKEEVIAIGDNINDQTMLENAGLGVAMGNSAPYIKKMEKLIKNA